MSLLAVSDLHTGYGEMEILYGVSASVEEGEIVTIIGPNGAGKSTLMKAMFGLLPAWQGEIRFSGEDITETPPEQIVRKGMCYVPQEDNIFPSLTVDENLEMGAYIRDGNIEPKMEEVYELFPDIADRRNSQAGKLSGGMRQMVAFGRALMLEPMLLLLDEPSAGLAPLIVELIFERIQSINEQGVTILMVEQNARDALKQSDRGYVLVDGNKRLEGTAQELLDNEEIGRLFLGE